MSCPDVGALRAMLDGEGSTGERAFLQDHLAACERCASRLEALDARRRAVRARLDVVRPEPHQLAAAQARARAAIQSRHIRRPSMSHVMQTLGRRRRPVLAGLLALVLVVTVVSWSPARALARDILAVFRVKQLTAVRIDPQALDPATGERIEEWVDGFLSQPEVVIDEPVVATGSIDEASALAGFAARMPAYLPSDGDTAIEVKGRTELAVAYTREALTTLLELAGMDAGILPSAVGDGEVRASFASGVGILKGDLKVIQIYQPMAQYPEGVDAALIGEAGLRILGVPADQAAHIAGRIDWTSTLLLPIPSDVAEFRNVEVGGAPGLLIYPRSTVEGYPVPPATEQHGIFGPPADGATMVLWERDDVLYCVTGNRSAETLLSIASSMY